MHYLSELLGNLGFSFQKARFVSDHLDEAKRRRWLKEIWPTFLAQAKAVKALLLFADEGRFAKVGTAWVTPEHPLASRRSSRRWANGKRT